MTAHAILWPPPLARRQPQIAAVLAGLFFAVLGLARMATLDTQAPATLAAAQPGAQQPPRPHGPIVAPVAGMRFRLALTDPASDAGPRFDPDTSARLARWTALLHDRASDRMVLTLATGPGATSMATRRVGAALVRLLAGNDVNPHRLRLVLAEAGDPASLDLGTGEFHLAIEMGSR